MALRRFFQGKDLNNIANQLAMKSTTDIKLFCNSCKKDDLLELITYIEADNLPQMQRYFSEMEDNFSHTIHCIYRETAKKAMLRTARDENLNYITTDLGFESNLPLLMPEHIISFAKEYALNQDKFEIILRLIEIIKPIYEYRKKHEEYQEQICKVS